MKEVLLGSVFGVIDGRQREGLAGFGRDRLAVSALSPTLPPRRNAPRAMARLPRLWLLVSQRQPQGVGPAPWRGSWSRYEGKALSSA